MERFAAFDEVCFHLGKRNPLLMPARARNQDILEVLPECLVLFEINLDWHLAALIIHYNKDMKPLLVASIIGCCTTATLFADFSYQQNSRITGGAAASAMKLAGAFSGRARESMAPMTSTVIVKGHRMAHMSADSAQIIDVDKETITSIDYAKKTYSVMTFDQMKQMMQDMAQRMGEKTDDANLNFKASVRETGQSKVVSGLNAKEMILTLTMEGTDQKTGQQGDMVITSDIWLAPDIPGYGEVRELHRAMAAKLGWSPGQSFGAMMGRSGMMKGMAEAGKEMAKLNGVPVLQVMTMNGGASGMPPGSAGGAQSGNTSQGGDANSQSAAAEALRGLGRLGGLGGLGRRKKDTDSSSQPPSSSGGSASSPGALMEITTESSGFSSAPVDASKFDVPSGFQQIEPQMGRRGGKR
jgi:hypothetical protein